MMPSQAYIGPLGFEYWPFGIVPNLRGRLVWADRTELKDQVTRLGRRLGRHDAVSLHLLWADFGAGKTHTLLYIKQEAEKGSYGSLLPLYSALPKGCRSFLDIYRAIVRAIPAGVLGDAYQKAILAVGREQLTTRLAHVWANLPRCFSAIALGAEFQQSAALAWLQAEAGIPSSDLRSLSLLGRIKSTDDAVLALLGIVTLLNMAGYRRVLLMIDEFQRVEVLRKQFQDDINAGLHGFFNACGQGMSLLLSFSFGVEGNIKHFLNPELMSRVDPLRISIPKLVQSDAVVFLEDVVAQARGSLTNWPVSVDVIPAIVKFVGERFELTPRRLLKAADLVFGTAETALEDGLVLEITSEFVSEMVDRGEFSRIDEGEQV